MGVCGGCVRVCGGCGGVEGVWRVCGRCGCGGLCGGGGMKQNIVSITIFLTTKERPSQ